MHKEALTPKTFAEVPEEQRWNQQLDGLSGRKEMIVLVQAVECARKVQKLVLEPVQNAVCEFCSVSLTFGYSNSTQESVFKHFNQDGCCKKAFDKFKRDEY